MSPRAASEVNPSIDIESSNVVRVISQLIELGQVRQDIELLKVRIFQSSSFLRSVIRSLRIHGSSNYYPVWLKHRMHIFWESIVQILGCCSLRLLFLSDLVNNSSVSVQSFFSGQRIETDILVNTLTKQDSCLVLMRKTANTRSRRWVIAVFE